MSHELRTPLNGIKGLLELLGQTHLTFEQQDMVDTLKTSALILADTINEVLDFAKLSAGQFALTKGPCNLRLITQQSVGMVENLLRQKNLELTCLIDPTTPDLVYCDETRLRQVLVNLLSNACKYTNQGSVQLHITHSPNTERPADENGLPYCNLKVAVTDTGIGISSENQTRLFEKYNTLHTNNDLKIHAQSTGLGLVITKHIVELMEGTIGVTSQYGQGSTFWFTLQPAVLQAAQRMYHPFRHVVLLDANETSRGVRKTALEAMGIKTTLEVHPKGLLNHPVVDAVIMDWPNPWMDEPDTLLLLQALHDDHIPVFCLTSRHCAPVIPVPITGLLYKPLLSHVALEQLLNPVAVAPACPIPEAVTIPLPVNDLAPRQPMVTPASATPSRNKGHILIVDDNLINQKVAGKFVAKCGYTFDLAENGQVALNMLQNQGPYLAVLMDCQMPIMDGYEATQQARLQPAFARLPIIAVTAHAFAGEKQKCLDAGMTDYLSKPLDFELLNATLEQYCTILMG
jgi:two-component system, sensor histidine kinase and response regulator